MRSENGVLKSILWRLLVTLPGGVWWRDEGKSLRNSRQSGSKKMDYRVFCEEGVEKQSHHWMSKCWQKKVFLYKELAQLNSRKANRVIIK